MIRFLAVVSIVVSVSLSAVAASTVNPSFLVGNSLTWDLHRGLARSDVELGAHIVSNATLTRVLDTIPPEIARGEVNWEAATRNEKWETIILQPFIHETREVIADQIARVQSAAIGEVVVYASLPAKSDFASWHERPSEDGSFRPRRQEYEELTKLIAVRVIPAGHVADRLVRDGVLDVDDLYRDGVHASYGVGSSVLGDTAWAFLADEYPDHSPYARQIWAELYPGDFDRDRDVDGLDFLAWQKDPTIGSFHDWQAEFAAARLSQVIPEPSAWLIALIATSCACFLKGVSRGIQRPH